MQNFISSHIIGCKGLKRPLYVSTSDQGDKKEIEIKLKRYFQISLHYFEDGKPLTHERSEEAAICIGSKRDWPSD